MKNIKIRAAAAWLLMIASLFSFVGCDLSIDDVIGGLPQSSKGEELQIAGSSVEIQEPETKGFFYRSLDEVGKMIYSAAYTAQSMGENTFTLTGVDVDLYSSKCNDAIVAFINENPELFWLDGTVEFTSERMSNSETGNIHLTFRYYEYWTQNDLAKAKEEFSDAIEGVISEMKTLTDDYEKVKFAHDHILRSCTYDDEAYETEGNLDPQTYAYVNSAYGAFVCGKIMCVGYTKAFNLLMKSEGIESLYVTGSTEEGPHAWNLVKLGEGYYHFDLTWDDVDDGVEEFRYNYFGVTDEEISKTHRISTQYQYPEANAVEYNYFVKEELVIDYYSFARVKKLAEKYDGGTFSFKCRDEKVLEDAIADLIDESRIYSIEIFEKVDSFKYGVDKDSCILSFYID